MELIAVCVISLWGVTSANFGILSFSRAIGGNFYLPFLVGGCVVYWTFVVLPLPVILCCAGVLWAPLLLCCAGVLWAPLLLCCTGVLWTWAALYCTYLSFLAGLPPHIGVNLCCWWCVVPFGLVGFPEG